MCGSFFLSKFNEEKIAQRKVEEVAVLLNHRGPDHWDYWEDETAFLLQTRLTIFDPHPRSNQPFHSKDGRYILIYNGECYNFLSLKHELESKGHSFDTTSDTEVLLYAFIEWGEEFIHKVAGMFSLIIYDRVDKISYIWRDRLGIKPLYFARSEQGIVFSSEIKPILIFTETKRNDNALWSYFNLRYVAGNETMFAGIHEVVPGSFLVCRRGEILRKSIYWDLRQIKPVRGSARETTESLRTLLEQVVSEHNLADTKVGCFLSGGIDSASIAALSKASGNTPATFTLSMGLSNDESDRASAISKSLGLPHETIKLGQESFDLYKDSIRSLENPIGDSIIVPSYLLSQAVSKSHKVVLSGEGADEIFSGYIHHQFLTLEDNVLKHIPQQFWKFIPFIARKIPLPLVEKLFPYPSKIGESGWSKVIKHLSHLDSPIERYFNLVGLFTDESAGIFSQDLKRPKELDDYWNSMDDLGFADRLKRFDLYHWARNYTLHRLDRLTMAHSLEARVPFFDHRLVEAVLKIPADEIYNFNDPKKAFRRSIRNIGLQKEVLQRKKQAFYLPVEKVYDEALLSKAKSEILRNASKRGIYNTKNLEDFLTQKSPDLLFAKKFQVLYNFELWCQVFID